jgi:hypothetical protein
MTEKVDTDKLPLLWECFTNWSDVLKKIEDTKKTPK